MQLKTEHVRLLCDPRSKSELKIENGLLTNCSGDTFDVIDGIPILLEFTDEEKNEYALNLFHEKADIYDKYQHLSFETFNLNETDVRNNLISKLKLQGNETVLELNAGTGRDSTLINKCLSDDGMLCVQDISLDMLRVLKTKFDQENVNATQSNAEALPYQDSVFDAVYSFGGVGMNTYSDTKRIMKEIVRVSKKGARVVIGGLGMAPWLYETEFGKILVNHNNHYSNKFDLADLPVEARNVTYEYILNGAGFCISFEVGVGEPEADFDYIIPGVRGGTLRTRYYGKLEGVSPKTKELALRAREKSGVSMYDFLNNAISKAAVEILESEI